MTCIIVYIIGFIVCIRLTRADYTRKNNMKEHLYDLCPREYERFYRTRNGGTIPFTHAIVIIMDIIDLN